MYCTNCGKEVDNNLSQYPYCSTPISMTKTENKENKGNVCQEVIGYCFPILEVIFYFLWKNTEPHNAKMAIKGAGIAVAITLLFWLYAIIDAMLQNILVRERRSMYCRNCGKEIDNNLAQCPYCNTPVSQNQIVVEDNGSMWWGVLGCCVPIAGLVLYIVWKDTKPQSGKKAGIGALIGFVLSVLIPILFYIFMIVLAIATYEL